MESIDRTELPEGAAQAAHRYGKQFKDGRPFEKMHVDAATDFLAGVRWLQSQNTSQPKDAGDDARYNPVTEIESLDDAKRMYDAILGDNTSQAQDDSPKPDDLIAGSEIVARYTVWKQPSGIPFIAIDEKRNEGWGDDEIDALQNCAEIREANAE